jgi:amino acid transporter
MILLYVAVAIVLVIGIIAFLIYRERLSNWRKWDRILAVTIIMLLLSPIWVSVGRFTVSGVLDYFTPRPLHPTYEALKRRGFYVFVLPEQEMYRRDWQQDITLWSWDIHCGLLTGDTYNPLRVTYTDSAGNDVFIIQHGPWGMVWDYSKTITKEQMPWESRWSSTGIITYRTRLAQDNMWQYLYHFSDMQGWGVEIASSLPVTETLDLIKTLEYIGPPIERLNDPWDCRH